MKKIALLLFFFMCLSACSRNTFVAGNIKKERKELYDYNNSEVYCKQHPESCVNNIPWH